MLADPQNATQGFWEQCRTHPGRPCLTDLDAPGAGTLSYAELAGRVSAVAAGLAAGGLRPGDRVALLLRNSIAYVECFLAAATLGAVVTPLNVRLRESDLVHMLADSGARTLVADSDLLAAAPGITTGDLQILLADGDGPGSLDAIRSSGPLPQVPYRSAEDPLSLMYTSGTTGTPKAVTLSHRSWSSVTDTAGDVLGIQPDEVVLHVAPLTHGAGFLLLPTLARGGHNLLTRSFDAPRTAELLRERSVSGMFLVPSMIRMVLDVLPPGWQLPATFRWLYYAGSPIDPDTQDEATRAFQGRLVQSFAQMESPMFVTVLDGAGHLRLLAEAAAVRPAGTALPGVELRIVGPDGAEVPAGGEGEVVVLAPQTMTGYWNRPEETAAVLTPGGLRTGDVGRVGADGQLYIVDRLKDMIVTGGTNVYAREVEDVLLALDGVREAAVIGLPDRLWGEAVTAVLVATGDERDTAAVLRACRRDLPGYRVPKAVHWLDELPRNSYGKVLKRKLREDLASTVPAPHA